MTPRCSPSPFHTSLVLVRGQSSPNVDPRGVQDTFQIKPCAYTQVCTFLIALQSTSPCPTSQGDYSITRERCYHSRTSVPDISACILRKHVSGPKAQRNFQTVFERLQVECVHSVSTFQNGGSPISKCSYLSS